MNPQTLHKRGLLTIIPLLVVGMVFISSQPIVVYADYNPNSEILSFDIDINTEPSVNYGVPLGTFFGTTSEPNPDKIYITVRDPDGQRVMNILRVSDSNGHFNYRFNVGDPTVLPKEGTYTATAHIYSEFEETFDESEQAGTFIVTFDNFFKVNEPEKPEPYITTDQSSYTYTQDLDIVISGNIGNLETPIKVEVQCYILPTPSTTITFNEIDESGDFEYRLATLGFGCNKQTSSATARIQGTDISTSFQMIGEEPKSDPVTPPTTTILSFDIDINTDPSINYGYPLGTLHGKTSQGNEVLYIVLRDPDGLMVWNYPRVSDSNGYFDYRFDIGNPSVLIKEGTYTAIAHLDSESEDEGIRIKFDNFFQSDSEPVPIPEPEATQITVSTDKSSYHISETISIHGEVKNPVVGYPVTLQIVAPNGNILSLAQLEIRPDNTFRTELTANSGLWKLSGTYSIKVIHGTHDVASETTFDLHVKDPTIIISEQENKIVICHIPQGNPENAHLINISQNALQAHLDHGDVIGNCPVNEDSEATSFTKPVTFSSCTDRPKASFVGNESIVLFIGKSSYRENETITFFGEVRERIPIDYGQYTPLREYYTPVSVSIIAPNGNTVGLVQSEVGEDNKFCSEFTSGGPLWRLKGTYTIKAVYGDEVTASTTFDYPAGFKSSTVLQTPVESLDDNTIPTKEENKQPQVVSQPKNLKSISIWSEKSVYEDGSKIIIEGKAIQDSPTINVQVYNPSNLNIANEQVRVSPNGIFQIEFDTSDYLWYENGVYVVQIKDESGKITSMEVQVVEPDSQITKNTKAVPESTTQVSLIPVVDAKSDNDELSQLIEENRKLKEEVEQQAEQINDLSEQVDYLTQILTNIQAFFGGIFD